MRSAPAISSGPRQSDGAAGPDGRFRADGPVHAEGPAETGDPAPSPGGCDADAQAQAPSTRDRILEAAARLFGEKGVAGATMRAITREAGANMAAVNYHFGGKDNLATEVFRNVARRTAESRLARLDALEAEAEAEGRPPALEKLVEIFIAPYAQADTGPLLAHLVLSHRVMPTEWTHEVVRGELDQLAARFIAALGRAAPHLGTAEVLWRYHFTIGALMLSVSESGPAGRMMRLSGGLCDPHDREALRRELVAFITGAFSQPAAPLPQGDEANDGLQDRDPKNPREDSTCDTRPSPP